MKAWALSFLRCPRCGGGFQQAGDLLTCLSCSNPYPIVNGVPRLLAPVESTPVSTELTGRIQRAFAFEWSQYARFGWDDPIYGHDLEQRVFEHKSLLTAADLNGRLVLDAGCGNGRYSYWAAKHGARVIAMDVSDAVDVAAANTADMERVQVVQGDIFRLPFAEGSFDAVFSIGVLMCTGDAPRACHSLARLLKSGGTLSVHVYGKGNVIYEGVDRLLRSRTTQMSPEQLQRFIARAYRVRGWLQRLGLIRAVGKMVRLDSHPHCILDWYGAPAATHHTYREVKQWFMESNLAIAQSREPLPASRWMRGWNRIAGSPGTVTVRGRREG